MTVTPKSSTFAGPTLNVYKKINVIRKPSDILTYEDGQGNVKTVSAEQLGDALTAASTPQTLSGNAAKPKSDIPVPLIRSVGSYVKDVSATFQIPLSYVRCHRPTTEELRETLEYVLDAEDEAWLQNHPKFGRNASRKLPMTVLERMIDLLEKETGFDSIITTNQAEDVFQKEIPELFGRFFPVKPGQGAVATKHVLNDVYQYWMQKRSRLKRPLFRQYWPVTSLEDTNPHLVFRPREKEKYKLRKKRQTQKMDAYRKLKVLREDFEIIRKVLLLIQHREKLSQLHLSLQMELHQQKLYDLLDSSGVSRTTARIPAKSNITELLSSVPQFFDTTSSSLSASGKLNKSTKSSGSGRSSVATVNTAATGSSNSGRASVDPTTVGTAAAVVSTQPRQVMVVAGQNHGTPAPSFVQPLSTRETFCTSWDNAVPHVTSYTDSHADPTHTFRYRPRLGRGGRVCIDRLPRPPNASNTIRPITVFIASKVDGGGSSVMTRPARDSTTRLLDLLPRPLDTERLSHRIEEYCVASIYEDAAIPADDPENDGEEVVVKLDAWLDTDEPLWGEEQHALGPL